MCIRDRLSCAASAPPSTKSCSTPATSPGQPRAAPCPGDRGPHRAAPRGRLILRCAREAED
eukprot:7440145-Alexandrium_andersonii.AAC.1